MASLSLVFDLLARDKASPEFKKVGDAADQAGKKASGMGSLMGTAMKAAGAAIAAAGIGSLLKGSIDAASDLSETVSKSNTIFGKNAGEINKWAKSASTNLGLSRQEALNAAAGFGDMFSQIGFAGDEAATMSTKVVQMSADLGSFNNLPTADVADRIGAAFRGEYDSLQALIPNINAARVESAAMAATGKDNAKQLTAQEKAAAVLAIVQKDGSRAMGDFARTSGGLANQQKILAARWEDAKAQLGGFLQGPMTAVVGFISSKLLPNLQRWGSVLAENVRPVLADVGEFIMGTAVPAVRSFAAWISRNRDVIIPVVAALGAMYAAFRTFMFIKTVIAAVGAFNAVLLANPIGLVIAAIGGLVAILVIAYKRSDTFRAIVDKAFRAVAAAGKWMWENVLKPTFSFLLAYWKTVATGIQWAWEHLIRPAWGAVVAYVKFMWGNVVKPYFRFIIDLWTSIAKGIGWVWGHVLKPVFRAFVDFIGTVKDGFRRGINGIRDLWDGLSRLLRRPIQAVVDVVWNNGIRKLWNKVNNLWGGSDLDRVSLATGGVLPGYTPGRDVHTFISPTGGRLDLSGGEAVMRPEFTRALGRVNIDALNQIARREGESGLRRALAAEVPLPNIRRGFADGGVLDVPGWMRGEGAGGLLASLLPGFGLAQQAAPRTFRLGNGPAGMLGEIVPGLAGAIWSKAVAKAKELFDGAGGGGFGASRRSPNGVGGLGPMAQRARAFVMRAFGLTNIGGYSYRTIAGTSTLSDHALGKAIDVMIPNYRSAASIARGNAVANWFVSNPGAFGTKYVIWRDRINSGRGWAPYGHPGGGRSDTLQHRDHVHVSLYDKGGLLPPGISVVKNNTGRPETVRTADQEAALASSRRTEIVVHAYTSEERRIAAAIAERQRIEEVLRG